MLLHPQEVAARQPEVGDNGPTRNLCVRPPTSRLPHSSGPTSFRQRPAQFSSKEFCKGGKYYNLRIGPKDVAKSEHFTGSRKVTVLPRQLGSGVPRRLGLKHNPGIQIGIPKRASANIPPSLSLLEQSMRQKGAITELSQTEATQGFYSSLFLVPKKDGGLRPVINLKKLNKFIAPHHFKMEGIHTLKGKGDGMTKVDLKDAYFMIPIHQSDRQYLRFSVQGCYYQFNCLPFGLSWVFTKTLKPVISLLRELGVRLVVYIDDILSRRNWRVTTPLV